MILSENWAAFRDHALVSAPRGANSRRFPRIFHFACRRRPVDVVAIRRPTDQTSRRAAGTFMPGWRLHKQLNIVNAVGRAVMKRPVFLAMLLAISCLAPWVAAGMPTQGETPSALSRAGLPEWPSNPTTIERRNPGLPLWATFTPAMLPLASAKRQSAPPAKHITSAFRRGHPRHALRVTVAIHRVTPEKRLRPVAMEEQKIFMGALY
jgi:hypothetical protein